MKTSKLISTILTLVIGNHFWNQLYAKDSIDFDLWQKKYDLTNNQPAAKFDFLIGYNDEQFLKKAAIAWGSSIEETEDFFRYDLYDNALKGGVKSAIKQMSPVQDSWRKRIDKLPTPKPSDRGVTVALYVMVTATMLHFDGLEFTKIDGGKGYFTKDYDSLLVRLTGVQPYCEDAIKKMASGGDPMLDSTRQLAETIKQDISILRKLLQKKAQNEASYARSESGSAGASKGTAPATRDADKDRFRNRFRGRKVSFTVVTDNGGGLQTSTDLVLKDSSTGKKFLVWYTPDKIFASDAGISGGRSLEGRTVEVDFSDGGEPRSIKCLDNDKSHRLHGWKVEGYGW